MSRVILAALFVIANIVDGLTTSYAITIYGPHVEVNPLAGWAIGLGGVFGVMLYKSLLSGIIVGLLMGVRTFPMFVMVTAGTLVVSLVSIVNIYQLGA